MPLSRSKETVTIALDAMGGDNAPSCVFEGANRVCARHPDVSFLIYGNEQSCRPFLEKYPALKAVSQFIATEIVISNDEKPSAAIRHGRNSSMGMAIKAVRNGEADAVVSSGNTGALMAIAKIILRTLPGIDRPAIGSVIPNMRGESIMLDLGANVSCDANNLFEFAVMGNAFAHILLEKKSPSIGLLNVGTEEMKGNEAVRTAASLLRENDLNLNFHGYVEGDDLAKGTVDVVVTDGFSGNIALKTAEGTAKMCTEFLKKSMRSNPLALLGGILAGGTMKKTFKRFDPRLHNGAMLLGLNGIVVKSHGSMDDVGFANAIKVARELVQQGINEQIIDEMVRCGHILPDDPNGQMDI